jgi:hypothetical protein
MAKMNGRPGVSLEILRSIASQEAQANPDGTPKEVKRFSYLDFFRDKSLRKPTICLMMIWFSWSLTSFGIGYNLKNMSGDLYLNMVYLGLSDALSYPSPLLTNNR